MGARSPAKSSEGLSAPVRLELPSQLTYCEPANTVSDRRNCSFYHGNVEKLTVEVNL